MLIEMISLLPKVSESDLLSLLQTIHKDKQDSVRMHSVDCIVAFAKYLPKAKISVLIPTI